MTPLATSAEFDRGIGVRPRSFKLTAASFLEQLVYVSLLGLIVLSAIPYGTSQPWWKALFVCGVFVLVIFWLVEGFINGYRLKEIWALVLPLIALALLSLLQTIPLGNAVGNPAGISFPIWNTLSADPYQTRFFALELLALIMAGVLLFRYVDSERRMRMVINVIIGVAIVSAIFGILRQTTQHETGFGLPLLAPDLGYGQFINKNHFAYLMEMGLGLILGLVLGGGVKREKALIYFTAMLPLWMALVLCGSRGGLVAMLAQIIVAALLFSRLPRKVNSGESQSKLQNLAGSLPLRIALVLVLVAGIALGTLWLGGDRLASSIEQSRAELNDETDDLRTAVNRNEIWKASWRMFKAHPVLGVGMGAYWAAIPAYHDASGSMTPQEAHNDYLELLASGGLVSLALGIWFAVVVCKRTLANLIAANRFRRAACYGAAIGIAGVAVHSLLDFGLHMLVNALVFTTLIVIATSKPRWGNEPAKIYD